MVPHEAPPAEVPDAGGRTSDLTSRVPSSPAAKMRDLNQPRSEGTARPRSGRGTPRLPPVVRLAKLPGLKPRPANEEIRPQEPAAQKPLIKLTPDMLKGPGVKAEDLINKATNQDQFVAPADLEDDEAELREGKPRPGQVTGRDKRHQQ